MKVRGEDRGRSVGFRAGLLALFCALVFCGSLRAEDSISAYLLVATNDSEPQPLPVKVRPYEKNLRAVFGYNRFDQVGAGKAEVPGKSEAWLVPSSELFLKADTQRNENGRGVPAQLELWQREKRILNTRALLRPGAPVLIRGPEWGNGLLILVVVLEP